MALTLSLWCFSAPKRHQILSLVYSDDILIGLPYEEGNTARLTIVKVTMNTIILWDSSRPRIYLRLVKP